MTVNPVDGTTPPPAPAGGGKYVMITQPDGSQFRIPVTQATWDPTTQKWVATPSHEASDLANKINRKYNKTLTGDDFLKLFVAQMRYQDPSKPADTTQMMQQSTMMAMVERVNEMAGAAEGMTKASEALAASNAELTKAFASSVAEQQIGAAVALVGRTVVYRESATSDARIEGVVDSVKFTDKGPIVSVNGKDVPLVNVVTVKSTATGPAPAPNTTPGATPGTPPAPAPSGPSATPGTEAPTTSGTTNPATPPSAGA